MYGQCYWLVITIRYDRALREIISVIQFGCRVRSHWFAGCYIRGSDNSRRNQRTIIRVVISARSSLVKI